MRRLAAAYGYAADRHAGQRRKGPGDVPYVNHVIDVARRMAESGAEETLVIAALLHDILEDTDGTEAEIAALFGPEVLALVREVSDDKALPKAERKRRQIETAPAKSAGARRIKLADMASNLASLVDPGAPAGWSLGRQADYVGWARAVAEGCRGVDPALEAAFDRAAAAARRHLDMVTGATA